MELIIFIMKFTGIRMILKYVIVLFTANAWHIFRRQRDTFYMFADHANRTNRDQRLTAQRWRKMIISLSKDWAKKMLLIPFYVIANLHH